MSSFKTIIFIFISLLILLKSAKSSEDSEKNSYKVSDKKPMEGTTEKPIKEKKPIGKPNIIVIMADDLGFNDVSVHGSDQIITPNIDALAYQGLILNRHYVAPVSTPSRSAFLTGKYPIKTGMQHFDIDSDEPWGLGLDQKLMPKYFKEAGYNTHLIGKWHLGFFRKAYTPTRRGFDHFYGYYGPYIDYWDHSLIKMDRTYSRGYDMRDDFKVDYKTEGIYATDLFTDKAVETIHGHDKKNPLFLIIAHLAPHTGNEDIPMQAPQYIIDQFSYIKDPKRRTLAAMIFLLDKGVGRVVSALRQKKMLDNTVILFYSDNGAPTFGLHANGGSNYPLRGQKNSPWEGGVRSMAAIWSPLLNKRHRVSNQLIYVSDWLATFANLAGIKIPISQNIDGKNIWDALSFNRASPRHEIIHNIDPIDGYSSFYRFGYKYINGTTLAGERDGWMGDIPKNENPNAKFYFKNVINSETWKALSKYAQFRFTDLSMRSIRTQAIVKCKWNSKEFLPACNPLEAPCLFNVEVDPCEEENLALDYPHIVEIMEAEVEAYKSMSIYPRNRPLDPRADPKNYGNIWTYWLDEIESKKRDEIRRNAEISRSTFII